MFYVTPAGGDIKIGVLNLSKPVVSSVERLARILRKKFEVSIIWQKRVGVKGLVNCSKKNAKAAEIKLNGKLAFFYTTKTSTVLGNIPNVQQHIGEFFEENFSKNDVRKIVKIVSRIGVEPVYKKFMWWGGYFNFSKNPFLSMVLAVDFVLIAVFSIATGIYLEFLDHIELSPRNVLVMVFTIGILLSSILDVFNYFLKRKDVYDRWNMLVEAKL